MITVDDLVDARADANEQKTSSVSRDHHLFRSLHQFCMTVDTVLSEGLAQLLGDQTRVSCDRFGNTAPFTQARGYDKSAWTHWVCARHFNVLGRLVAQASFGRNRYVTKFGSITISAVVLQRAVHQV